ncbi:hypothetical protein AB1L42_03005 [Thalassoglobus sp. JC818]|uniref:hypothetical protein n=1 Tax=Thalassoglobus sp. JC818 TaxID=3232136 RepID=UPI003457A6AA
MCMHKVVCVSFLLACATTCRAGMTFSDGTFEDANWTATTIASTGGTSFNVGQTASGGNPGTFRQIQNTYGGTQPTGSIFTGHLRSAAIYDPSTQGEIQSLDFAFDLIGFDFGASNAVAYTALLFQDGFYYSSNSYPLIQAPANQWNSFTLPNLVASGFSRIGGAGETPDFSATGTTIQFGYGVSNGTGSPLQTMTDSGIDNWQVTVNANSVVPEPSSFALFIIGCLPLLRAPRNRKTPKNR